MNQLKILVVDLETTGFLAQGGKIVECGIVSLDLASGLIEVIYDKVFNPGLTDDELNASWIVKNGYMTIDEIKSGCSIGDEIEAIQHIINSNDNGLTAYNRGFDIPFMESVGLKFNKLLPCPMIACTDICRIPGSRGGFKWPKFEEAYFHFFPESGYNEQHRAKDDASHEAMLIHKLFKSGLFLQNIFTMEP